MNFLKPTSLRHSASSIFLVFLICCSLTGNAEPIEGESALIRPAISKDSKPSNGYNISFKGGNLVELLKIIKTSSDGDINLIWSAELESEGLVFPKLDLKNVTANDLISVIDDLIQQESAGRIRINKSGNICSVSVGSFMHQRNDNQQVVFLKIEDLLQRYPLEAITTAIETGWEMAGVYEEAIMKFHPDTNLLVFRGGREAVDVVYSVFGQLETPTSDSEKGSESEDDK